MSGELPISVQLDSDGASAWSAALGPAQWLLRCDSLTGPARLIDAAGERQKWDDPLAALEWMEREIAATDDARCVGYLSYDLGRLFERLPATARDDLQLPLFCFSCHAVGAGFPRPGVSSNAPSVPPPVSNFSRAQYARAVARAIEYIAAGDIFQVNLSQRFTLPLRERPRAIYERLHRNSPARYGAMLDYGDFSIVSNSPELFLRIAPRGDGSRRVLTRPIKGTRPALSGKDIELRDSIKDQAELNMIVDLERNDLGRVCEVGSVRVSEPRMIERHPTVFHGVAGIEGTLGRDVRLVDLLRATFPGGSITGAPKIRAMEIIEELEGVRRGPYCGAIGYIAADGSMEFNIAIRTMVAAAGQVHASVGGGIVADSAPSEEYEETLVKAKAMLAALGVGSAEC